MEKDKKINDSSVSISQKYKKRSQIGEVWHNFKKNKGAVIGLILLAAIIIVAIAANSTIDYDKIIKHNVPLRLKSPSLEHPFGTDQYGRDIFLRILYGAKYSLSIGFAAVFVSLAIGAVLGIIAGYYGGAVENTIMRICDVFSSIPSLLLAISVSTAFGTGTFVLMFSVGLVSVPAFARVARASVMTVVDSEFIEAARAAGATKSRIMFTHILPNAFAPIIVQATMRVGSAITMASSLSFLDSVFLLPHLNGEECFRKADHLYEIIVI